MFLSKFGLVLIMQFFVDVMAEGKNVEEKSSKVQPKSPAVITRKLKMDGDRFYTLDVVVDGFPDTSTPIKHYPVRLSTNSQSIWFVSNHCFIYGNSSSKPYPCVSDEKCIPEALPNVSHKKEFKDDNVLGHYGTGLFYPTDTTPADPTNKLSYGSVEFFKSDLGFKTASGHLGIGQSSMDNKKNKQFLAWMVTQKIIPNESYSIDDQSAEITLGLKTPSSGTKSESKDSTRRCKTFGFVPFKPGAHGPEVSIKSVTLGTDSFNVSGHNLFVLDTKEPLTDQLFVPKCVFDIISKKYCQNPNAIPDLIVELVGLPMAFVIPSDNLIRGNEQMKDACKVKFSYVEQHDKWAFGMPFKKAFCSIVNVEDSEIHYGQWIEDDDQ